MDSVFQAALNERETLRKQAASIETRLKEVEEFLSLYSQFASTIQPKGKSNAQAPRLKKASTKVAIREATDILKDGKPRPTRALIEEMRRRGFDIGGRTDSARVTNLSNTLSREAKKSGLFKADRAVGWSLKAPKSKDPMNASTSTGPDLRGNNNALPAGESHPQG